MTKHRLIHAWALGYDAVLVADSGFAFIAYGLPGDMGAASDADNRPVDARLLPDAGWGGITLGDRRR